MVAVGFALMILGSVLGCVFRANPFYYTWKDVFPAAFYLGVFIFATGIFTLLWEHFP